MRGSSVVVVVDGSVAGGVVDAGVVAGLDVVLGSVVVVVVVDLSSSPPNAMTMTTATITPTTPATSHRVARDHGS